MTMMAAERGADLEREIDSMLAVADFFEYGQGPMPGDVLLIRLVKYYEQPPDWFIGKDLYELNRLMQLDLVARVSERAADGVDRLSDDELRVYHFIEQAREADTKRYHGPTGVADD